MTRIEELEAVILRKDEDFAEEYRLRIEAQNRVRMLEMAERKRQKEYLELRGRVEKLMIVVANTMGLEPS